MEPDVKIPTAKDTKHAKSREEIPLCPFALLACFAVAIFMIIGAAGMWPDGKITHHEEHEETL